MKQTELDVGNLDGDLELDSGQMAVLDYEKIREIVRWFAPENIPTSVEEFKKDVVEELSKNHDVSPNDPEFDTLLRMQRLELLLRLLPSIFDGVFFNWLKRVNSITKEQEEWLFEVKSAAEQYAIEAKAPALKPLSQPDENSATAGITRSGKALDLRFVAAVTLCSLLAFTGGYQLALSSCQSRLILPQHKTK
ncbi:MAG: hypothetical protein JGK21_31815 [Microcoleus sp. PH2017_22_RUC_O_B]|uniref:hypothetical protein n=1 Tax=unclassified Microcoleus TaxID=2642155 RepID=UPI001D832A6C|nr:MULTISPECIES: hypothetical protein [unclassified Microcoleus]MCC3532551.1 hypothetical protein [Microcoleus sp. PH2017_21_RUC_O_A]MCC3544816.1 hypothetical protein [Microcoleus sp. PH2017_22_RUC_O_B]